MNRFSRDLVQGMREAADFVEGNAAGARVHAVEVPDVPAIRLVRDAAEQGRPARIRGEGLATRTWRHRPMR